MRRTVSSLCIAVGLLAPACAFWNLDRYAGGVVDASDGSLDAEASTLNDAEAGLDAATDADANVTTPRCDLPTSICDDFDTPPTLTQWVVDPGSGSILVDTGGAVSQPSSLLTIAGGEPHATKTFVVDARSAECEFDFQIETGSSQPDAYFDGFFLRFTNADNSNRDFYFDIDGTNGRVGIFPNIGETLIPRPAFATWVHVRIVIDLATGMSLSIDGVQQATLPMSPMTPTGAEILLGGNSRTAAIWQIRYDNVRCAVTPR